MAADESYLERFEEDDGKVLAQLVKIQALIRGHITRKQMEEIQQLYEEIVHDIEGPDMLVTWSESSIPHPTVKKLKASGSRLYQHDQAGPHNKTNATVSCVQTKEPTSKKFPQQQPVSQQAPNVFDQQEIEKNLGQDISDERTAPPASLGHDHNAVSMLPERSKFVSTEVQTDSYLPVPTTHSVGDNTSIIKHTNDRHDDKTISRDELSQTDQIKSISRDELSPNNHIFSSQSAYSENQKEGRDFVNCELKTHQQDTDVPTDLSPREGSDKVNDNEILTQAEKLTPEHSDHQSDVSSLSDVLRCEDVHKEMDPEKPYPEDHSSEVEKNELFECLSKADGKETGDTETGNKKHSLQGANELSDLPDDKDQLLQLKKTTAMELLWVQQAINSRKHYLRLKEQLQ